MTGDRFDTTGCSATMMAVVTTGNGGYGTAENMLHRAGCARGEHVLVTGVSGGVGSATVQLAKCRDARVTAVARLIVALDMRDMHLKDITLVG